MYYFPSKKSFFLFQNSKICYLRILATVLLSNNICKYHRLIGISSLTHQSSGRTWVCEAPGSFGKLSGFEAGVPQHAYWPGTHTIIAQAQEPAPTCTGPTLSPSYSSFSGMHIYFLPFIFTCLHFFLSSSGLSVYNWNDLSIALHWFVHISIP